MATADYAKPIELRITRHPNGEYTYYTVLKVYPGVGNTAQSRHKHMTRKDVKTWCEREYPGVPRIWE